MKQKLLFFLAAFSFAVCTAVAQDNSEIIVLDSTYTQDAISLQRTYYEYNERGQEIKETTITEQTGKNDMVSRVRYTYDDLYRLIKIEGLNVVDGNEIPAGAQAYYDFDENGHAATVESIDYDEDGITVTNYVKVIVSKYATFGDCMLFFKTYTWQNGEWVFESETTGTENEKGLRETTTTNVEGGVSMVTTYTYYDNNLVKSVTYAYKYNGIEMQSSTVYYFYEYGDYGAMPVFTTIKDESGNIMEKTQSWYSPLNPAGIQNIIAKSQQPTMIFDLSGKFIGNSIEGLSEGVYIVKDALGARKIKK